MNWFSETLIVWTEPDGVDYALSFQDPDGCAEVWGFIQEVQRLMKAGEHIVTFLLLAAVLNYDARRGRRAH
jgi:hypothetical protein